jgi:hypothetical protein
MRRPVTVAEDRVMRALGRILRTWSLIKLMPMRDILPLQKPLLKLLSTRSDLSEDQLVALGLKQLYADRKAGNPAGGRDPTSTPSLVAMLRQAAPLVSERRKTINPNGGRLVTYTVIAVTERTTVSIRRRGFEEAISTADSYRRTGATNVSIRAPDGKTYSLAEFAGLSHDPS